MNLEVQISWQALCERSHSHSLSLSLTFTLTRTLTSTHTHSPSRSHSHSHSRSLLGRTCQRYWKFDEDGCHVRVQENVSEVRSALGRFFDVLEAHSQRLDRWASLRNRQWAAVGSGWACFEEFHGRVPPKAELFPAERFVGLAQAAFVACQEILNQGEAEVALRCKNI